MANGNISFKDLLGLYSFGPSYGALKTQTRKRGAQKDLLDFLSESGGLGGTTRELAGGQAIPPAVTTGQFDPAGVAGLAIGQPTPGRDVPVRESQQFQEKYLNLLATQDKLSAALAPPKPETARFQSFVEDEGAEAVRKSGFFLPSGGLDKPVGRVATGPAFAPKGGRSPMSANQIKQRITALGKLAAGEKPSDLALMFLSENPELMELLGQGPSEELYRLIDLEMESLIGQLSPSEQLRYKTPSAPAPAPGKAPTYQPGDYQKYRQ